MIYSCNYLTGLVPFFFLPSLYRFWSQRPKDLTSLDLDITIHPFMFWVRLPLRVLLPWELAHPNRAVTSGILTLFWHFKSEVNFRSTALLFRRAIGTLKVCLWLYTIPHCMLKIVVESWNTICGRRFILDYWCLVERWRCHELLSQLWKALMSVF